MQNKLKILAGSTAAVVLIAATGLLREMAHQAKDQAGIEALRTQARAALSQTSGELKLAGLRLPVEVLRDSWGVPHIYAKTQEDLFFAQGFVAAQDRMWQLELWRRKAEGRLAELLGPAAVERDRYARLLRYRGDWEAEWRSYSPDARAILESFVRGINAYLAAIGDRLPIEFQLLGIRPEPWTPEVCVSRLAAYPMTGNAEHELLRAEIVARLGPEHAAQLFPTDPARVPRPAEGFSLEGLDSRALQGLVQAGRDINSDDFGAVLQAADSPAAVLAGVQSLSPDGAPHDPEGSNNWAVAGARTRSGKPILANDPHRALLLPSLRYIVHLVAPGWDVVGAGEPALPGVSIGHNQRIAFGLTVFAADQQDIVVERTHPDDPDLYFDPGIRGNWRKMDVSEEEFRVRGEAQPRRVRLKFTRHGPVIYEDLGRRRAFVLRWAGTEPGTAGYLAGLAISRAQNWQEFRTGLERWKIPPENFVYADVEGNIGYQAAGLVPAREKGDGLLPVPGDTQEFDWHGFLKLDDLPHEFNPARGFVATANHNALPPDERRMIGFEWSPPYRVDRIREVLGAARGQGVVDSERLQADVTSLLARELLPLVAQIPLGDARRSQATALLRAWDGRMDKDSAAAAIFAAWLTKLRDAVYRPLLPAELWPGVRRLVSVATLARALLTADPAFFPGDAKTQRDRALATALDKAFAELEKRLGPDVSRWRWGALHTAAFPHPLGRGPERAALFSRGPVERSGDTNTVNATGGLGFPQTEGASFRQVLDLANWDDSAAINVPGESGQPESPHYDDLLPLWAHEQYFPLIYSRAAVEKHTESRLLLLPRH